jgi:hypothetical protein
MTFDNGVKGTVPCILIACQTSKVVKHRHVMLSGFWDEDAELCVETT